MKFTLSFELPPDDIAMAAAIVGLMNFNENEEPDLRTVCEAIRLITEQLPMLLDSQSLNDDDCKNLQAAVKNLQEIVENSELWRRNTG